MRWSGFILAASVLTLTSAATEEVEDIALAWVNDVVKDLTNKSQQPSPPSTPAPEGKMENPLNEGNISMNSKIKAADPLNAFPGSTQATNTTPEIECGWSNPGAYTSVTRTSAVDHNAMFGEYPWMVAVMKRSDDDTWSTADYIGGGSIIHPSVVITVAHKCSIKQRTVKIPASQLKCRAGEWDTQTTREQYPFQERNVAKYTIHPKYYPASLYYDAALLFLEQPFRIDPTFSPHMGIACLATTLPHAGESCDSMGWGTKLNDKKKNINVLKKVSLDLLDGDKCQTQQQKTRLGPYFRLHKSLFCASGQKGADPCTSDSGSSLVCPIEGDSDTTRYAVYGMMAYDIECGKNNVPGVYVKIPEVLGWVNEQMTAEGYGTASYTYSD